MSLHGHVTVMCILVMSRSSEKRSSTFKCFCSRAFVFQVFLPQTLSGPRLLTCGRA
jgi:hypothetical protein